MVSLLKRFVKPFMCYSHSQTTLNPFIYTKNKFNVGPTVLFCTKKQTEHQPPDPATIIKTLGKGDPEIENKLKVLMLEVEVMRQDGRRAPAESFMQMRYWEYLLSLNTISSRMKYLSFLWKNNMASQNDKVKKAERNKLHFEEKLLKEQNNDEDSSKTAYTLGKNSMFIRINDKSLNTFYNFKMHQAALFGRKIVLDCSYSQYMSRSEETNAAKQLTESFALNRTHKEPMDMHFCNVDRSSILMNQFERNVPCAFDSTFPIHMHSESYLDIFPKEKLVYLTPHCKNDLVYDSTDIYIVGAIVDKRTGVPISLAKAKEHNLRMAKFPLDRYLSWSSGSGKSLTINQVVAILADMNTSQNWEYALRHVPRRKLIPSYSNRKPFEDSDDSNNMLPIYVRKNRHKGRSLKIDDLYL